MSVSPNLKMGRFVGFVSEIGVDVSMLVFAGLFLCPYSFRLLPCILELLLVL